MSADSWTFRWISKQLLISGDIKSGLPNFTIHRVSKTTFKPVKVTVAFIQNRVTFSKKKVLLFPYHWSSTLFSLSNINRQSKQNEVTTIFQDAGPTLKLKAGNARSRDRFLSAARTYKKSSWRCRRFFCCPLFCSPATCRQIRKIGRGFPRRFAKHSVFSPLCYHL